MAWHPLVCCGYVSRAKLVLTDSAEFEQEQWDREGRLWLVSWWFFLGNGTCTSWVGRLLGHRCGVWEEMLQFLFQLSCDDGGGRRSEGNEAFSFLLREMEIENQIQCFGKAWDSYGSLSCSSTVSVNHIISGITIEHKGGCGVGAVINTLVSKWKNAQNLPKAVGRRRDYPGSVAQLDEAYGLLDPLQTLIFWCFSASHAPSKPFPL